LRDFWRRKSLDFVGKIHLIKFNKETLLFDESAGSLLLLDDAAVEVAKELEAGYYFDELESRIIDPIKIEALMEFKKLAQGGLILNPVSFPRPQKLYPKSLCLIVSHACNMACSYCSLSSVTNEGNLMKPEIAKLALDWLIRNAPGEKIDVDFFGGEPLLAWTTVKEAILFGEELAKSYAKKIRWSMSTNAIDLTEYILEFCQEHYISLVLSLDGPREINDLYRVLKNGEGSYNKVFENILRVVNKRDRGYYVRGTYTKKTIDFADSIITLHKMGITSLAFEPVVTIDPNLAITLDDIPKIKDEYEKLARYYISCKQNNIPIRFYHFELDLENGPCERKSAGGCGAGAEYLAISPKGDIWPCHQFDGMPETKLGTIFDPPGEDMFDRFAKLGHITGKQDCSECWAAYLCAGGCLASNHLIEKNMTIPYKLGCALQKTRLDAALWILYKLRSN